MHCFSIATWINLAIFDISLMVGTSKLERYECNTRPPEGTSDIVEEMFQVVYEIYYYLPHLGAACLAYFTSCLYCECLS